MALDVYAMAPVGLEPTIPLHILAFDHTRQQEIMYLF